MNIDLDKINLDKIGFCRFKKFGRKYLLTNDIGEYIFLTEKSFIRFLEGNLDKKTELYKKMESREFIRDYLDFDNLIEKYRSRNAFLAQGPSLHIVVVTLRCNHKCIYCQVSSRSLEEKGYDMDIPTARKVVDTIFCSPNKNITIEFQGGEPLVNWPTVKFIVEYAREKNKKREKDLWITLVSNFSLLDEKKLKFLFKNRVGLCTSLDGPEKLHNKNRILIGGNSYEKTVYWVKRINNYRKEHPKLNRVNALLTISRYSLKYPKEIIDEYLKWGFSTIHLRPLSYLGLSGKLKDKIGYSTEEFLRFWREAMDYIIELNFKKKKISERGAVVMLRKILTDQDPGYLDLRSPCGAGIGQLSYNYNGDVFTCDEGRMLEDDVFKIGNVKRNSYQEIVSHDAVKAACIASCLDNLPCDYCCYKPYCGVCPVLNYALYGNLFASLPNNDRCRLNKGMLDYLFQRLQNKKIKKVFDKWLGAG